MGQLRLAANFIEATGSAGLNYWHLQIVFEENGDSFEIEVQSPLGENWEELGDFAFPNVRNHLDSANTTGTDDETTYRITDIDVGDRNSDDVWQVLLGIHEQFEQQSPDFQYTLFQNSNSYAATLLWMVGVNVFDHLPALNNSSGTDPLDANHFPGITRNILTDGYSGFVEPRPLSFDIDLEAPNTGSHDVLNSGDGDDTLLSLDGDDSIHSGEGSDVLVGGSGSDILHGGEGVDTVDYSGSVNGSEERVSSGVTVSVIVDSDDDLVATVEDSWSGRDTLLSIEEIVGTSHDDIAAFAGTLSDAANASELLQGGVNLENNSTLGDTVQLTNLTTNSGVSAQLDDNGYLSVTEHNGNLEDGLYVSGVENVVGSNLDDNIAGNADNNILLGGGGADIISAGAGDDIIFFDADDIDYDAGVFPDGGLGLDVGIALGSQGFLLDMDLANLEVVVGGSGNDDIGVFGTGSSDVLMAAGGDGNDTFLLGGNNTAAVVWGGAGADIFEFQARANILAVSVSGLTTENFSSFDLDWLGLGPLFDWSNIDAVVLNPDATDQFYFHPGTESREAIGTRAFTFGIESSDRITVDVDDVHYSDEERIGSVSYRTTLDEPTSPGAEAANAVGSFNTSLFGSAVNRFQTSVNVSLVSSAEELDSYDATQDITTIWVEEDYEEEVTHYFDVQFGIPQNQPVSHLSQVGTFSNWGQIDSWMSAGGKFVGTSLKADGSLAVSMNTAARESAFDFLESLNIDDDLNSISDALSPNAREGTVSSDSFSFAGGAGQNIVQSFDVAEDTIEIDGQVFNPNVSNENVEVTQAGNNVSIDFGTNDQVILVGVDLLAWQEASPEEMLGTETSEELLGTAASDQINGLGGNDTLNAQGGDDTVFGGAGVDRIVGGRDNDQLSGGVGADIFVFEQGDGSDTITDFTIGSDKIEITTPGVTFGQLAIIDTEQGAQVNYGTDSILLNGINAADLSEQDFNLPEPPAPVVVAISNQGSATTKGQAGVAETFTWVQDSSAKARLQDVEWGTDRIDLSFWGVESFDELTIVDTGAHLSVRGGGSKLQLNYIESVNDISADDFIFAEPSTDPGTTDPQDPEIVAISNQGSATTKGQAGVAETFTWVQDSSAKARLQDVEWGTDRIDLSFWGVESFDELTIVDTGAHLSVRGGGSKLQLNYIENVSDISADDFIFAEPSTDPGTIDPQDPEIVAISNQGSATTKGQAGVAETFTWVQDSSAKARLQDVEWGTDRIDLSFWGVESFDELTIVDTGAHLSVRGGGSKLQLNYIENVSDISADDFIFAEPTSGEETDANSNAPNNVELSVAQTTTVGVLEEAEIFVFQEGTRSNARLQNFEQGLDKLDLAYWGLSSHDELSYRVSGDHLSVFGGGHKIQLRDLAGVTELSNDDILL